MAFSFLSPFILSVNAFTHDSVEIKGNNEIEVVIFCDMGQWGIEFYTFVEYENQRHETLDLKKIMIFL